MRHPVLTAFAMMSFIGAASFAVACAKDGPEIEPIVGTMGTDPGDGGETKTITVPTKEKKKSTKDASTEAPVVDAGPADTGAPPAGDDDDDDDDDDVTQADCPAGDQSYLTKYLMASMGGGTMCTSGGDECNTGECCFVYPIPGLGDNYCVAQ